MEFCNGQRVRSFPCWMWREPTRASCASLNWSEVFVACSIYLWTMTQVHLTLILSKLMYLSVFLECPGNFFTHKPTTKLLIFPAQISIQNILSTVWKAFEFNSCMDTEAIQIQDSEWHTLCWLGLKKAGEWGEKEWKWLRNCYLPC